MTYRYPSDIAEQSADYVVFKFYDYVPPFKADAGAIAAGSSAASYITEYNASTNFSSTYQTSKLPTGENFDDIIMYMPEDVAMNYSQNWAGREFHPLAATALRSTGQYFGGVSSAKNLAGAAAAATTGIGKMTGSLITAALNGAGGSAQFMTAGLIAQGLNMSGFAGGVSANDVLASQGGNILNPNTEVLYQGPQLRTFAFNFKMSARNSDESKQIQNICKLFKIASLPRAEGSGQKNLIGVPRIVQFTFKSVQNNNGKLTSIDNPWIPKFKPCAIGSVNVNYTPNGVWSTFEDGSPVAVNLTIQLQELKIIFDSEISGGTFKDTGNNTDINITGGY